jgi:His-Xaa-Ser system protein HxsD
MSENLVVGLTLDRAHIAVAVDLGIFSVDAVLRATYKLADRCYPFIHRDHVQPSTAMVCLVGRSADADIASLALELQNELVDQQLRCRLDEQFKDLRTLIVAQAFSEGNLLDPTSDVEDYRADPHGAGQHR